MRIAMKPFSLDRIGRHRSPGSATAYEGGPAAHTDETERNQLVDLIAKNAAMVALVRPNSPATVGLAQEAAVEGIIRQQCTGEVWAGDFLPPDVSLDHVEIDVVEACIDAAQRAEAQRRIHEMRPAALQEIRENNVNVEVINPDTGEHAVIPAQQYYLDQSSDRGVDMARKRRAKSPEILRRIAGALALVPSER